MTLAQMNNEQKNNISHRGLAIKKFVTKLELIKNEELIIFVCLIGVLFSNSIVKEITFDPFINSKKQIIHSVIYQIIL